MQHLKMTTLPARASRPVPGIDRFGRADPGAVLLHEELGLAAVVVAAAGVAVRPHRHQVLRHRLGAGGGWNQGSMGRAGGLGGGV